MATTYYCDYENGDDTADGITTSTPFKHIPKTDNATSNALTAGTSLAAGDSVLLARGSTWLDTKRIAITNMNNASTVTYGVYDRPLESSQADPIVEMWDHIATGDWTYVSNNIWWATGADNASVQRLFFNGVGQAKAVDAVSCDATRLWFPDSGASRVYCYSGSATLNPTDVYGDVTVQISDGTLRSYGFYIVNVNNLLVQDIHIRGASNGNILNYNNAANPMNNITMQRITVDGCNQGFRIQGTGVGSQTDIVLDEPRVYMDYTTIESTYATALYDGISVAMDINGLLIDNPDIRDTTHACINIVKTAAPGNPVQNVRIRGGSNMLTAPNSDYCRGISCNGVSGYVKNIKISGLHIYNTNVRNQIEGENILFTGNIIDTVRENTKSGFTTVANGLQVQARSNADVDNVTITNNIVTNAHNGAFHLFDTAGYPITSANVYNNIFDNKAGAATDITFKYTENDVKGTLDIANNVIRSENTTTTVTWDGVDYTVAAAEAALTEMHDNLITDPILDSDYKPTQASPVIGAGKVIFGARDYRGRRFKYPPNIGAYSSGSGDVAQTRTAASTRSAITVARTART